MSRKVQELEKEAFQAVAASQKRRRKRKEIVVAHRRQRSRKLLLIEEVNRLDTQPETTTEHCKQESLGGLVTQMP